MRKHASAVARRRKEGRGQALALSCLVNDIMDDFTFDLLYPVPRKSHPQPLRARFPLSRIVLGSMSENMEVQPEDHPNEAGSPFRSTTWHEKIRLGGSHGQITRQLMSSITKEFLAVVLTLRIHGYSSPPLPTLAV